MRKTVIIKRKPNTTNLPNHIYDSAKKRIGSTFKANGDVNTGLTNEEVAKYMPEILSIDPKDVTFYKTVKDWFTNLSVDVPPAGIELEIGIEPKTKRPYEIHDYIKYKYALVHPYVLLDESDTEEKRLKRKFEFIIEDKSREHQKKVAGKDARKTALKEWIKLTADENKMDQVLRVLGTQPDTLDKDTKELKLEEYAKEDPKKFTSVATNKDLAVRSFIKDCLTREVLRKIGNTYLNGEETLGDSEEEVIVFLNDKKNSETLLTLKSRLKQFK